MKLNIIYYLKLNETAILEYLSLLILLNQNEIHLLLNNNDI